MLAKLPAPLRKIVLLLKEAVAEWREDNASRLAAALSYHTAFSLAPLLVIVLAVAGLFWGAEAVHSQFLAEMRGLIGQDGADFVAEMLASASQGDKDILAMVIGTATLLLGATGAFNHLHEALNAIWDVPEEKVATGLSALARGRMISFGMLLTVGFLLLVSLVVSAAVAAMDEFLLGVLPSFQFLAQVISFVLSYGLITVLFAVIYKWLPDARIGWRDVWVGAVITAVLFSVGKFLIGLYLGNSSLTSTYGAAASFAIILVWIYYSAQIFFFGAELTQVYANRYGSRIAFAPDASDQQPDRETAKPPAANAPAQADDAPFHHKERAGAAALQSNEQVHQLPAFSQARVTSRPDHESPVQLSAAGQQSPPAETAPLPRWVGLGGLLAVVGLTIGLWLRQPKQQDYQ